MILISVLYQNASTSRILEPSPQGLTSSEYYQYTSGFFLKIDKYAFDNGRKSYLIIVVWATHTTDNYSSQLLFDLTDL